MERAIDVILEKQRMQKEQEETQQDVVIRLEALKLAHTQMNSTQDIVSRAQEYFNFLKGTK